jgi:hypothetical protein
LTPELPSRTFADEQRLTRDGRYYLGGHPRLCDRAHPGLFLDSEGCVCYHRVSAVVAPASLRGRLRFCRRGLKPTPTGDGDVLMASEQQELFPNRKHLLMAPRGAQSLPARVTPRDLVWRVELLCWEAEKTQWFLIKSNWAGGITSPQGSRDTRGLVRASPQGCEEG